MKLEIRRHLKARRPRVRCNFESKIVGTLVTEPMAVSYSSHNRGKRASPRAEIIAFSWPLFKHWLMPRRRRDYCNISPDWPTSKKIAYEQTSSLTSDVSVVHVRESNSPRTILIFLPWSLCNLKIKEVIIKKNYI